ncbi:MAG: hypothetical protein JKY98_10660 [Gammaproteobacteria bacterium]|nr:hypothetical protein [Gammaproteobacteria bacterium]
MATILFKLRNVPEDEAEEVRSLFEKNGIDTYETSAGNWKISMPAIWLKDDQQLLLAKKLLQEYQQGRYQRAREEYEEQKQQGRNRTMWSNFLESPLKVTLYVGFITIVIYLSLQLFI